LSRMPRDDGGNFVENALVKIPVENLGRIAKSQQKAVVKELEIVSSALSDLRKGRGGKEVALAEITRLVGRIQGLKRKLAALDDEEEESVRSAEWRLEQLKQNGDSAAASPPPSSSDPREGPNAGSSFAAKWGRQRLDRAIAEHLAREGLLGTAQEMVAQSSLERLVDLQPFLASHPIIEALSVGDCALALKWCHTNRPKLKKLKSSLEFNLRLQEFVELVRGEKLEEAIAYARKHLAPLARGPSLLSVKRHMALLVLRKDTEMQPYKHLLDQERWLDLVRQFRKEVCLLNSLPAQSLLSLSLCAGLTCLKSTKCQEEPNASSACPVCHPLLGQLATALPFAHHMHSSLVCHISGLLMDENNPPMVLPNGQVYSTQAMLDLAAANMGRVVCPRTKEEFGLEELRKAFIS